MLFNLSELKEILDQYYSLTELRELCLELNVEYENFGDEKSKFNLNFVNHAKHHGYYRQLVQKVIKKRPHLFKSRQLLHNLPNHTTPFIGRELILQQLSKGQGGSVICGMGGVGKSQLMRQFAELHSGQYTIIWWLNVDGRLQDDYLDLGRLLSLPPLIEANESIAWVRNQLNQTQTQWLLLFDNADEADLRTLKPYLPTNSNGRFLITSRHKEWGGLQQLNLDLFTSAEATTFWQNRLGNGFERARTNLAQELGFLPLALEHAAAYMKQNPNVDATDYNQLFKTRRQALWQRATQPDDYHATISSTWDIGFQKIEENPAAAILFQLCCFLSGDHIPLSLFTQTPNDTFPQPLQHLSTDILTLNDALTKLERYALISRIGNSLAMHKLVQDVARDRINLTDQKAACQQAVSLLFSAWPFDMHDLASWPLAAELLPHLIVTTDLASNLSLANPQIAYLNNEVGRYLKHVGNLNGARPYSERALAIREKILGPDHTDTATSLNNLGLLLNEMGELDSAWHYLKRALIIRKKMLGFEHPDTATSLNNLGMILKAIGHLDRARLYLEKALTIYEKVSGPNHYYTAAGLHNLGLLLQSMKNLAQAQPYLERALTIRKETLGLEHPDTATSLNNLGMLLKARGHLNEAKLYLEQALAIYEKVLGPDHYYTATSLHNLGLLLKDMGDLVAARPYYGRALVIWEKVLGPDHHNTTRGLNNLGLLLKEMGDFEGARPYLERALAIREKTFGPEHPRTNTVRANLESLEQSTSEAR